MIPSILLILLIIAAALYLFEKRLSSDYLKCIKRYESYYVEYCNHTTELDSDVSRLKQLLKSEETYINELEERIEQQNKQLICLSKHIKEPNY